jgi:YspA, cpYpsA-related SLOG family
MRILITGSRTWTDYETISNAINDVWLTHGRPYGTIVVHGNARGADYLAGVAAKRKGFEVETHPVSNEEWKIKGLSAGHQRNANMVDLGADVCLAFIKNESNGATGCAALAEKAGIPTHIWREP